MKIIARQSSLRGSRRTLPRSSVEKIFWPAPMSPAGAQALALQFQLDQSQWWSPEELLHHQMLQLDVLVRHAHDNSNWWAATLDGADVDLSRPLEPDTWSRIPLLPRATVQAEHDALHCDNLPKSHGRCSEVATSGSTGVPVRVTKTSLGQAFWRALALRDYLWHRLDLRLKMAAIRHADDNRAMPPQGIRQPGWGRTLEVAFRTGPAVMVNVHSPIEAQVKWLQRERPGYLLSYPSNMSALARYCIDAGIGLPGLRAVRTIGESLDADCRDLVREAWGVPLFDLYSTQEVGYLALQCPDHEHYHVQSEGVLLEILRDDGTSCGPGEIGRVVATGLHNFRMPLIRYEVGDYAEVGEPCPCGRGLPVIRQVLGRQRNMLRLPNGALTWPQLGGQHLVAKFPIRQVQFVQVSMEEMELRMVVSRPLAPEEEDIVRRMTVGQVGHPFRITLSYHDHIPRSRGGKFEEFRSEVS